jgi:hypothetical protein
MSALVSTVVAALSAFAVLASLFLYLYFGRRSDLAQTREEALALAQTRGQVIRELRGNWTRISEGLRVVTGASMTCGPSSTRHGCRRAKTRIARSTSTPLRSLTSSTVCGMTSSGSRPMSRQP